MNLAIVGSPAEPDAAPSNEHRSPVRALRIVVRPHALARVDIPGLHFTEVIRELKDQGCDAVDTAPVACFRPDAVSIDTCW